MINQTGDQKGFELNRRLAPLFLFLLFFILVVIFRVLYLQVGLGREFEKLSAINRITHRMVPATRGSIYDKNGRVLAGDKPMFNLIKSSARQFFEQQKIEQLSDLLELDKDFLWERARDPHRRSLVENLTDDQRIKFAENSAKFEGVMLYVQPRRVYSYGHLLGPVIGYTGEVSPEELLHRRREGLSQGDIVGKTGIEQYYDRVLRGREGLEWIETTAAGRAIRTLEKPRSIPAQRGDSLQLNIDIKLQQEVAGLFGPDSAGAVVVMEIPGGEVRTLYSHPTYDPNDFVMGDRSRIQRVFEGRLNPLMNRAVQGRYPPGSTFKLIAFMAALRSGEFTLETKFDCPGYFYSGKQRFHCWREQGHGKIDLEQALVNSCNVYFYNLARHLDYGEIVELAEAIEFSEKTGIDLPGENRSQLSSPALLAQFPRGHWTEGEEINAIIGQGYTLVTPLQQARSLAGLVSGKLITPRLVGDQSDFVRSDQQEIVSVELGQKLLTAMDRVTLEGTGFRARFDQQFQPIGPAVAGKTGTVQKTRRREGIEQPPADAWFVSAVPSVDPRYIVVVYLADAGSAARSAAPLARQIYIAMESIGYFDSSPKIRGGK